MGRCEICGQYGGHLKLCPYYVPPKALKHCVICEDGIYDGEEYIENADGEYMHLECVQGIRQLLGWLGEDIKMMEDFEEDHGNA